MPTPGAALAARGARQLPRRGSGGSSTRRGGGGALGARLCRNCFAGASGPAAAPLQAGAATSAASTSASASSSGPHQLVWLPAPTARESDTACRAAPSSGPDPSSDGNGSSSSSNNNGSGGSSSSSSGSGSDGAAGGARGVRQQQPAAGGGGREAQQGGAEGGAEGEEGRPNSLGVRMALSALSFYRGVLSPLMPSVCRFLPTCSNYSIESYKRFGVTKGTVLTAWRLLRCNPWGGRGYDPPSWPPVGLGAVYELPYTPEATVVLGVWLVYWFVSSTIDSLVW